MRPAFALDQREDAVIGVLGGLPQRLAASPEIAFLDVEDAEQQMFVEPKPDSAVLAGAAGRAGVGGRLEQAQPPHCHIDGKSGQSGWTRPCRGCPRPGRSGVDDDGRYS